MGGRRRGPLGGPAPAPAMRPCPRPRLGRRWSAPHGGDALTRCPWRGGGRRPPPPRPPASRQLLRRAPRAPPRAPGPPCPRVPHCSVPGGPPGSQCRPGRWVRRGKGLNVAISRAARRARRRHRAGGARALPLPPPVTPSLLHHPSGQALSSTTHRRDAATGAARLPAAPGAPAFSASTTGMLMRRVDGAGAAPGGAGAQVARGCAGWWRRRSDGREAADG
jgi:hypothetical protein